MKDAELLATQIRERVSQEINVHAWDLEIDLKQRLQKAGVTVDHAERDWTRRVMQEFHHMVVEKVYPRAMKNLVSKMSTSILLGDSDGTSEKEAA